MGIGGEGKSDAPATSAVGAGLSFQCNKWGREKRVSHAAGALLSFTGIHGQRIMTNEGSKPPASTAGTCLSVMNIGNAPMPNIPWHLHLVNCFQEGIQEFDSPMGQCFSRFPTVSQRNREGGGERKKVMVLTGRVNPNCHMPHLQVQLAFVWHSRLSVMQICKCHVPNHVHPMWQTVRRRNKTCP